MLTKKSLLHFAVICLGIFGSSVAFAVNTIFYEADMDISPDLATPSWDPTTAASNSGMVEADADANGGYAYEIDTTGSAAWFIDDSRLENLNNADGWELEISHKAISNQLGGLEQKVSNDDTDHLRISDGVLNVRVSYRPGQIRVDSGRTASWFCTDLPDYCRLYSVPEDVYTFVRIVAQGNSYTVTVNGQDPWTGQKDRTVAKVIAFGNSSGSSAAVARWDYVRLKILSFPDLSDCQNGNTDDTDGDALLDCWEIYGIDSNGDNIIDFELYDSDGNGVIEGSERADPNRKDIFVYIDWLEDETHSDRPNDNAINLVIDAFANAPVDNNKGINLHVVFGQGIEERPENCEPSPANDCDHSELGSVNNCNYSWNEFDFLKEGEEGHFPPELKPIFHYAIFGHDMPTFPGVCHSDRNPRRYSGYSRNDTLPDNGISFHNGTSDFIVTLVTVFQNLRGNALTNAQAGTFMHELGHNLGLGHGGLVINDDGNVIESDHTNNKPNYLSVMNYLFQSRGLRMTNEEGSFQNGYFDYSRFGPGILPNLVENDLDEGIGLNADDAVQDYGTRYYCQGADGSTIVDGLQQPVNWNCNTDIDGNDIIDLNSVSTNINKNNVLQTLATVNEWPHLVYNGGSVGAFGVIPELPETTSAEVFPEIGLEEDKKIGPFLEPGDLNSDGQLDFNTDFPIFLEMFGQSVSPSGTEPDYDGDGIVGLGDYSIFLSFFQ